ncbi:hypothetical protein EGR_08194 [Echinococcus granulosus]|uniref:SWIM-type domain-containing protein n=1 Tax=Echinococcus granulosus TaxID=6210 RepID=W6UFU3_ECHGR|nr:hypothetical protein EGR_08194 [Echinococcus granulosus]EUB56957.1 hypothetical protein EGR_08194 [Echinococcus granulosus]
MSDFGSRMMDALDDQADVRVSPAALALTEKQSQGGVKVDCGCCRLLYTTTLPCINTACTTPCSTITLCELFNSGEFIALCQCPAVVRANSCRHLLYLLVLSSVCVMSCVTIFLLLVPSAVLSATFLAIASFGIALKTSDSLAQELMSNYFKRFRLSDSELRGLAKFAAENDHTAAAFIVVGLVMTAVCLIGCIPALFKRKILLNIYTNVLLVLLFVEAIVMAVYLANPDKLDAPFLGTIAKLLEEYKGRNGDNSTANVVWNAIMESGGRCLCPKNVMEEMGQDAGTSLLHAVKAIRTTGGEAKLMGILLSTFQSTVIPLPIIYAFLSFLDEVND